MQVQWQPSPNYAPRTEPIKYVIIHCTELATDAEAAQVYMDPKAELSAHYQIGYDGSITNFVRENMVAWHAGKSQWFDDEKLNQSSIGIEISNMGEPGGCQPYAAVQYRALGWLLKGIMTRHNITPECVLGHSDVAPNRKIDPGKHFNWAWLEAHNMAAPWSAPKASAKVPAVDIIRMGGYRGEDKEIIAAFQRRHCPDVAKLGVLCPKTEFVIRKGKS